MRPSETEVVRYLETFAELTAAGEWIAFRNPNEGGAGRPIYPGKSVGSLKTELGRWRIAYKGYHFARSRINWTAMKGPIRDGLTVDHVNEDTMDDCPTNLRLLTLVGNARIWWTGARRNVRARHMRDGKAARVARGIKENPDESKRDWAEVCGAS